MTTIHSGDDVENPDTSHDLIFSLSLDEEIIQFNKESERLTGYMRDEILHKKFYDVLVPEESTQQWKELLDSIRHSMWIDNIVLPLKTKDHQNPLIAWTGFLVKDEHGSVKDICIFGKPLKTEVVTKEIVVSVPTPVQPNTSEPLSELSPEPSPEPSSHKPFVVSQEPVYEESTQQNKKAATKHGLKKIRFARDNKTEGEKTIPLVQHQSPPPAVAMGNTLETTSKKLDTMNEVLSTLSQKYETVAHRVTHLEGKEEQPKTYPKQPDTTWYSAQERSFQSAETQKETQNETEELDESAPQEEKPSFFSDPFGFKRQHRELDLKQQQIEERLKQVEAFEARLIKERQIFNARVEEFSKWREKLLLLESAIERRRQELMSQENITFEKTTPSVSPQEKELSTQESQKKTEPVAPSCDDGTLEKISQSAAIIQRGILKQINTAFLELLGYTIEEILEKSYFDFIALDGLADVEKYYLDRLKGDSVSMYRTVFTTKDNCKIPVEVSIKQTIYHGEKAEIVLVTCVDTANTHLSDESVVKQ